MQIAMPLLVRQLLTVLSNNPGQNVVRQGMPYAVGIFLTVFVNGLATHRHRHLAMKSGVLMRAAVVEILYEQVLRLTPKGRTGLTSGQVANLVAVDTQKVRYDTVRYDTIPSCARKAGCVCAVNGLSLHSQLNSRGVRR